MYAHVTAEKNRNGGE